MSNFEVLTTPINISVDNTDVIIDVTVQDNSVGLITNPIVVKGDKGDGFVSDEYVISSSSTEWIINHNKGYYPSVIVFDNFNRVVLTEINHISTNQVRIVLSSPQTGRVIIN